MTESNLCTIYIVRHGETDWNLQNKVQGHSDIPLNVTGESQAALLREEFKNIQFAAVFSSDLLRAHKTAEIINLEHKLAIQATKVLRERSFGHFEGQSSNALNEMNELFDAIKEEKRFSFKPYPDVESDEELVTRVIILLREISIANPGKNVLVVSHAGVMRNLLVHLGFNYVGKPYSFKLQNGAYIKFQSDGVDFFIKETKGIESRTN